MKTNKNFVFKRHKLHEIADTVSDQNNLVQSFIKQNSRHECSSKEEVHEMKSSLKLTVLKKGGGSTDEIH